MKIFNLIILSILAISLSAQTLDEELGFIYVKADYLLETNRYEEAIAEFSKIVSKDPAFRDALYKRAEAKFHVGAFKGTRNDLLEVFDVKGITPESVLLFGKAQKNLGDRDQAATTMETADILFPEGGTPRKKSDNNKSRTESAEDGLKDEIKKIEDKVSSILDDLLPKDDDEDTEPEAGDEPRRSDDRTTSDDRTRTNNDSGSRGTMDRDTDDSSDGTRGSQKRKQVEDEPVFEEPVVEEPAELEIDDSVRKIYIDDEVTLEVKNGLGARDIMKQPSILILSDTSGEVVIDICVDERGKVTQAEFNSDESSLNTQSIISLAVRKAKEFIFDSSGQEEMCGTIVYKITGS